MDRNANATPEWMKPENWPERRQAPGYPRKFLAPVSIIFWGMLLLAFAAFSLDWPIVGGLALGFLVIGLTIVYQLTLYQFRCPKCGKRLPVQRPSRGDFYRFHCRDCRTIWLTGVQVNEDSGS